VDDLPTAFGQEARHDGAGQPHDRGDVQIYQSLQRVEVGCGKPASGGGSRVCQIREPAEALILGLATPASLTAPFA
jgi:hypothetical protein